MSYLSPEGLTAILQIVLIDILLAGDNAVVIALACRALPPKQRRIGILLGAGVAIGLRIVFAGVVSQLLAIPFLKLVGGLLLFWIAIKLAVGEDEHEHNIAASNQLWKAVYTIAIADLVMSLDNVIAISGAAKGDIYLIAFGLILSVPLIILGSTLITTLIQRVPIVIWIGAALLGWIAGEMIVSDPWIMTQLASLNPAYVVSQPAGPAPGDPLVRVPMPAIYYGAAVVGALVVVIAGFLLKRRRGEPALEPKSSEPVV